VIRIEREDEMKRGNTALFIDSLRLSKGLYSHISAFG
jgi:hypothetical protein